MASPRWLEKRQRYWARLDEITSRAGNRGIAALSAAELQELSLIYRQAATDLATLREDPLAGRAAENLNRLLGRAHNLIYMGRRSKPSGIGEFYRRGFPQAFRRTFLYTGSAAVVFFCAGVAGFFVCLGDPSFQRFFLGSAMSDTIERRQMWTHSILTIKPLASSVIMTNNLTVSFAMFAAGITAGVGTVYMLLTNGLLFGVIVAACWQAGMAGQLFSFVAPHGVLELPAVFIAGAGGLLIGRGLLFPGALPRRDALVHYAGAGVRLALGIIPILVVAGILEAFVSPSGLSPAVKGSVAALMAACLVLYLGYAGREPS
ncbi:MAG: stage II sporulation protein M [Terriglobia bacterium]